MEMKQQIGCGNFASVIEMNKCSDVLIVSTSTSSQCGGRPCDSCGVMQTLDPTKAPKKLSSFSWILHNSSCRRWEEKNPEKCSQDSRQTFCFVSFCLLFSSSTFIFNIVIVCVCCEVHFVVTIQYIMHTPYRNVFKISIYKLQLASAHNMKTQAHKNKLYQPPCGAIWYCSITALGYSVCTTAV